MRILISIPIALLVLVLCQPSLAQNQVWQTVSIPGICIYQLPPSVEIQSGTYKECSDKIAGLILKIETSPDRVIAQPKGINDFQLQALAHYCRVIVETDRGRCGEYESLGSPLAVSEEELRGIDSTLKRQMQQTAAISTAKGMKMELLSWQLTKVVKVNGVDALKITYTRSMNDGPPAIVNMYLVQNNDCMHRITISYRLSEKKLWANDLEKVIYTFRFTRR